MAKREQRGEPFLPQSMKTSARLPEKPIGAKKPNRSEGPKGKPVVAMGMITAKPAKPKAPKPMMQDDDDGDEGILAMPQSTMPKQPKAPRAPSSPRTPASPKSSRTPSKGGNAHPGFQGAKEQIMKREGLSADSASRILGFEKAHASPAAKARNPNLNNKPRGRRG